MAIRDELTGWWTALDRAGREGERAFCFSLLPSLRLPLPILLPGALRKLKAQFTSAVRSIAVLDLNHLDYLGMQKGNRIIGG